MSMFEKSSGRNLAEMPTSLSPNPRRKPYGELSFFKRRQFRNEIAEVEAQHALDLAANRALRNAEIEKARDDTQASLILAAGVANAEVEFSKISQKTAECFVTAKTELRNSAVSAAMQLAENAEAIDRQISDSGLSSDGLDYVRSKLHKQVQSSDEFFDWLFDEMDSDLKLRASRSFVSKPK